MSITKNKSIRIVAAVLILGSLSGVAFLYHTYHTTSESETTASFHVDKSSQEVTAMSDTLRNAQSKTIGLTFTLSATTGAPAKLASQTIYTTRPDRQQLEPQQYTLQIGDQQGEGYTTSFSVPEAVVSESFDDKGKIALDRIASPSTYSIIVPWFPDGTSLSVKNAKGTVILQGTLKSTPPQ